jgi:probable O-glycosylation ligase (exosortase A-associated)
MKQTILMILLTLYGTAGVLIHGPFAAIAIYYLYAVLRPQYLWEWALPSLVPWSQFVAIAALVGTVFWRFSGDSSQDQPSLRLKAAHLWLMAFGLWVCLSHFTAQDSQVSWRWLQEYAKILLMFFLASQVLRKSSQAWRLYLLVTLTLSYLAYEMTFLYIFEGRVDIYHNGYSGLDNNGAALMFAMGFPLAIFAWDGIRRWWRWIFALAVPLILHTVMISYSRGAMLSIIVTIPLILIRMRRRLQVAILMPVAAAAILYMAGPAIRARFLTIGQYEVDQSANSRFGSWQAGIRIANDYPIFGVGIRNSSLFSHKYGADMEGRVIHSQYIQILADSGYPALIFYCIAVLSSFLAVRRARSRLKQRKDEEAERLRAVLSGAECSLAVFVFGAFFLSLEVFELPYIMMLLSAQVWAICYASDQQAVIPQESEIAIPCTATEHL